MNLSEYSAFGLLALRIAVGVIFLVHGKAKWAMWKMQSSEQMKPGMINLLRFLSIAEPLGGLAVLLGFLTPLAALGLAIIMLGAIHAKISMWKVPFMTQSNTGWEFDLMILGATVAIIFLGAGSISLDQFLWSVK